jgi:rhodanese-related sulfurtransferase
MSDTAATTLAASAAPLPELSPEAVRDALRAGREIALIDVREEDPYAQAHPLFAAQFSAGRLELDVPWRLPRRDVTIAVFDDGDGLAEPAARQLQAWGYSQVHLLSRDAAGSGLGAWREGGGELFRDVNVPSKAFGELVEHERHTPSLSAQQVQQLISSGANVRVLDARRFDEFNTMSIPSGTSVPGGELVLRLRELVPDPSTQVIVNCAGRTRSIIGTQSLVNAGIPNPVAALRNGTIGWLLAGQTLDHGQTRRGAPDQPDLPPNIGTRAAGRDQARRAAQALADRAGARRLDAAGLAQWQADASRTLYRWDVRTPDEYAAGHLAGFGSAPGGQLVQETDVFAAVRGARIVLADGGPASDGVRAAITAHWLAQLGWDVAWLSDVGGAPGEQGALAVEAGAWQPAARPFPAVATTTPAQLADWLAADAALPAGAPRTVLLDFSTSAHHVKGHIPGARWLLRAQLATMLRQLPAASRLVATCGSGALARFAAADLARLTDTPVSVLDGGHAAWVADGRPLQAGEQALLSPRTDRYRRPYEGTDAPREAMQAYLDWEFGLVAQLGRDGTHGFQVLA